MTSAKSESTGWPDGLMRLLDITWPSGKNQPMHPAEILLREYDTRRPIHSAIGMVLTAEVGNAPITAQLTMLVGDDGLPLIGNPGETLVEALDEHGEPRTGVFKWAVVEMRVAE